VFYIAAVPTLSKIDREGCNISYKLMHAKLSDEGIIGIDIEIDDAADVLNMK
jgi:hypothetical protein